MHHRTTGPRRTTPAPSPSAGSSRFKRARIHWWTRAALALVAPTAMATTFAAAPAQAASDCTTDCISVTATPGLAGVKLNVSATTTAHVVGRIATKDGVTGIKAFSAGPYWGSTFIQSISGLPQQGTVYRYDVYATDLGGNTWRETGYFSTLVRDVAVHFDQLQISDDTDAGGPGELVGGVQLYTDATKRCSSLKALSPLKLDATTSMSSGSPMTVGSSADLTCTAIGPSVQAQSMIADDDTDWPEDCSNRWPWGWDNWSWDGYAGGDSCADWNYSDLTVSDPLPEFGITSTSSSFTTQSHPASQYNTGPQWTLTGSAKWSHRLPAVTLPATTGGAAHLPLTMTPKPGAFTVTWNAPGLPATAITRYLVQWRKAGTDAWLTTPVNSPGTSATISDLAGGAGYEVRVSAEDADGFRLLLSSSYVVTQPLLETTISGWTSASIAAAPGGSVAFAAAVSGDPRPVQLQTRRKGTTEWWTHAELSTGADDAVSGATNIPVSVGIYEWRLYAPQNGPYDAAASAVRTVSAKSAITGFATTKASVPTGTILKDGITVSPGAGRTVVMQYRKPHSTTWTKYTTITASDSGQAVVRLKAFAGSRYWRVKVAQSPTYGTGATTAARLVKGT